MSLLYLPVTTVCEKGLCLPWGLELMLYLILGEFAILVCFTIGDA